MNPIGSEMRAVLGGLGLLLAGLGWVLAEDPEPADPIAGREHWAFRPLKREHLEVESGWARSAIDEYVLRRLLAEGLRPAEDATRRELIRRVYFQLVGLPPTEGEIRAFLKDDRAGALERIVDQLLSSPQFGERWGRHWLDLARYADSNGLDENFLFREAWRYRNWVIDAVNADLPYDRFVLEQIAGDLLPTDSVEERDRQRIAAGFLVVGPKVLLGNIAQRQRMEVADEQIDTVGRTFLGQTLGCARCHDHKFDPVPTADYYALAGIFTSTQVMEQRYMLGQQRVMEQLVGLGGTGEELDQGYEEYWREIGKAKEAAKQAKSVLEFLEKDDQEGLAKLVKEHASALAEGAQDESLGKEKRVAAQKALLAERAAVVANPPKIPARAMIPCDVEKPGDESIRLAGVFDSVGEKVPRGFLQVVSDAHRPELAEGASGRVELGRWLTDGEMGAGRLTARVMDNRVWHHLMGRGIVRTVDNFGRAGEAPTHPELLDYLAAEFIDSDWSVKSLVKRVVMSRTFAMSSHSHPAAAEIDPDNRLLWRAHQRRLDPESLRDAILSVAGTLDSASMDSTVSYLGDQATAVGKNENRRRSDYLCRSVYLPVIRNDLPEIFEVFDFADPHVTTGARPRTTDPKQGLFLMNNKMVLDAAGAAAKRILAEESAGGDAERIDRLSERMFGVVVPANEREDLLAFIAESESRLKKEGEEHPKLQAWTMASHAMFSMSRFQFID